MFVVVADSRNEFTLCMKKYNLRYSETIFINTNVRGTWNKLYGLKNPQIVYWGTNEKAIPKDLFYLIKTVMDTLEGKEYLEWFCPFGYTHIEKACFEKDCPYLECKIRRVICLFFKEQIKKGKNTKKFSRDIDEGSDTRAITMDLIEEILNQNLTPVRIVVENCKNFVHNRVDYQYNYRIPTPTIIESVPENRTISEAPIVGTKEIPVVFRDSVRDAITVEAV